MKIAINCAFFKPKGGGIKEYIHNLIDNLEKLDFENEYIVYILENYVEYAKIHLAKRFKIKIIPFRGDSMFDNIRRSILESFFWRKEEKIEKWDIFHSPFFHSPLLKNTKTILTVHDLRFKRFPKTYAFLRYHFLKHAVKRSILQANHIISISNFTKNEIMEGYGVDSNKITVIHEAVNKIHFKDSGNITESDLSRIKDIPKGKFIFSVGHIEPRKNYNNLIEAFKLLKEKIPDPEIKLVIVGKRDHDYKSTLKLIDETSDVVYLDFVSNELLSWLYSNARMFVFPSIYEGFGFPPLEAAVNGLISSVSNASCIPEVCCDYVDYFDPYNLEDMAASMFRCFTDETLRRRLGGKLDEWISSYSWEKNAEETIKVYSKAFCQKGLPFSQ